jgi:hypothetical protein
MSLPDSSYPEDELDRLVQGALKARVGGQEPPGRVWKRIERELGAGKASSRRSRRPWSPLALQTVLTLLLMMIGGVGLQTLLNADRFTTLSEDLVPSVTVMVAVESRSPSSAIVNLEEADQRLLRSLSKYSLAQSATLEPASPPPISVPRDVPPNVFSPAGRARQVELTSLTVTAEERGFPRGGPYRWYR